MKNILLFSMLLIFSGCSKVYYLCTVDDEMKVYLNEKFDHWTFSVPAQSQVIASENKKTHRVVTFGDREGFIRPYYFKSETRIKRKSIKRYRFTSDGTYWDDRNGPYVSRSRYNKPAAKKESYNSGLQRASSSTPSTYSGGSVNVKGYYRKDGTYVKPHTRSAPTRRH